MTIAMAGGVKAAVRLPYLGEVISVSSEQEARWGKAALEEWWRFNKVWDDPLVMDYLALHGQLLKQSAFDLGWLEGFSDQEKEGLWYWMPINEADMNAFALPGRVVGVYAGLLATAPSASAVSAVLAHELSHVALKHIARMIESENKKAPLILGSMLLGVAAAGAQGQGQTASALIAGGQAWALQSGINYTREMEIEADRVGQTIHYQAGFDLQGFTEMLQLLQQQARLNQTESLALLSTHPLLGERLTQAQVRMKALAEKKASPEVKQLQQWHPWVQMRAQVMASRDVGQLKAWGEQAQTSDSLFLKYRGALALWVLKEHKEAVRLLLDIQVQLSLQDRVGATIVKQDLMRWWAQSASGSFVRAMMPINLIRSWVRLDHSQRAYFLSSSEAGLALGLQDQVASRLQQWVVDYPQDVAAWSLLSKARQAQGKPITALWAEAEAYKAMHNLIGARDRLQAALDQARRQNVSGSSFEVLSIVARLKAIQAEIQAEKSAS